MEVFWFSGSSPCWRVLLTLEIKNISYESRLLEVSKGALKSPEFLAVSPRGKVPALRDGDYVLTESLAIMAYLDRKYPDPALFGGTAAETGRIWRVIAEFESYLSPSASRVILPLFRGQAEAKAADIKDAVGTVHTELKMLDDAVRDRDWLAGGSVSAADIAVHPALETMLRAAGKPAAVPLDLGLLPFAQSYPALDAWRRRMTTVPGYDRAYPPHWRAEA